MTRDDPIGYAGQTRSYTPATALSSAITTLPSIKPVLHLVVGKAQGVGAAAPALLISPDSQVAGLEKDGGHEWIDRLEGAQLLLFGRLFTSGAAVIVVTEL